LAGHSKWAQIKRQKAVTDAARGRTFGKMGREIAVAARLGALEDALYRGSFGALERLLDVEVDMTIVGGVVLYERRGG